MVTVFSKNVDKVVCLHLTKPSVPCADVSKGRTGTLNKTPLTVSGPNGMVVIFTSKIISDEGTKVLQAGMV